MATHPPATAKPRDRFFYTAMAVVAASLVFAGFARTYYLRRLFTNAPLKPLLHLHGFLFTSWLVLLLAQVTLVAAKRTDLHRRLGVAGGVLAALMVVVGPIVAIHSARGEFSPDAPDPLRFLVVPLFDILVFAILVAAALYYRRQPQTHKRLMLVATFALLPPAVARLPLALIHNNGPLIVFGVNDLLLLACIAYDTLVHRRLHPAYLWAGLLLTVSHPARLARLRPLAHPLTPSSSPHALSSRPERPAFSCARFVSAGRGVEGSWHSPHTFSIDGTKFRSQRYTSSLCLPLRRIRFQSDFPRRAPDKGRESRVQSGWAPLHPPS